MTTDTLRAALEEAAQIIERMTYCRDGCDCYHCEFVAKSRAALAATPTEEVAVTVGQAYLREIADSIDPFTRTKPPDNLKLKCAADALRLSAAAPAAPEGDKDAAEEVAELVATHVLHHIDTMYPAMWKAVAKTARTSIRNTIESDSNRFLAAIVRAMKAERAAIAAYLTETEPESERTKLFRMITVSSLASGASAPTTGKAVSQSRSPIQFGLRG